MNSTTTPIPDAEREADGRVFSLGFVQQQAAIINSLTTRAERAESEISNLQEVVRIHSAACIRAGIRASHAESLRDDMETERDAALAREARLREAFSWISNVEFFTERLEDGDLAVVSAKNLLAARAALASTSEPQQERVGDEGSATVDDLAMLMRQLVHRLKKHEPDSDLATKAADYLRRKGLQGNIFRSTSEPQPAAEGEPK